MKQPSELSESQPIKLSTPDKAAILEHSAWLARMDTGLVETLARYVELFEFRKGANLFRQGDEQPFMGLVHKGRVEIRIEGYGGDAQTIALVGEGHPIGEMSLVDGGARSATAVAVDESHIFILTEEHFSAIRKRHPALWGALLIRFMRTITQRLRRQSGQFVTLLAEHGSLQSEAFEKEIGETQAPTFAESDSQQLWKQLALLNHQFSKVNQDISRFIEHKKLNAQIQLRQETSVQLPPALFEQLSTAARKLQLPVEKYVIQVLDQQMNGLSRQSVDFLADAVLNVKAKKTD